jgi:hypothetical protein
MKAIIAAFVCTGALILVLVACGPQVPQQPSATATPTPCATPGAATGVNVSGSATTGPAARTTPGAAQPTVSPAELATREAVLGRTNGSGPTLPAGQPKTSALPLCPTPTPVVR